MGARWNDEIKRMRNEIKTTKQRANSFSSRSFYYFTTADCLSFHYFFPFSRSYDSCELSNMCVSVYEHIHANRNKRFSQLNGARRWRKNTYCVSIAHAYSTKDLCRWPLEHKQMNTLKWPGMSLYQWKRKKKRWKKRKKKEKKNSSLLPEASRFIIIIIIVVGSKYNKKKKKNRSYC
jgi:hypothetical protein